MADLKQTKAPQVVAVPVSTTDAAAPADPRFGRAPYFYLADPDGGETFLENTQNLEATQGAGIQSAQNILSRGAEAVLTGHCGPKAFKVLTAGGVKVYFLPPGTPADRAVREFREGKLSPMEAADVEGHWV